MPLRPTIRACGLLSGHVAAASALRGEDVADRPSPLLPNSFGQAMLRHIHQRLFSVLADRLQLRAGVDALAHGLARHIQDLRGSGHVAARLLKGLGDSLIR